MNFNEAIKKIEDISKKMDGSIELEESVKLFTESVELTKMCADKIKQAGGKILEISKKLDEVIMTESDVTTE